jgi:hypothetical protein
MTGDEPMKTKAVVVASVVAVVMLMTINAIYADCGGKSCDPAFIFLSGGDPYCHCVENECANGIAVCILYTCGRSTDCDIDERCVETGENEEVELMTGGTPICYSIHEEAPWCDTGDDCDVYCFVDCFWEYEKICHCASIY